MTDDNNKTSGFELDAIDLSSFKKKALAPKKKIPDAGTDDKKEVEATPAKIKKTAPDTKSIPVGESKDIPTNIQNNAIESDDISGNKKVPPTVTKSRKLPVKKKEESKKNSLILSFIILVLIGLSILAFLNFKPALLAPEKVIDNKLVVAIKQKTGILNKAIKDLDKNISSKTSNEEAMDISLNNVEVTLNSLNDYDNAVSSLINSRSSTDESKVFYEARFLYGSEMHENYISDLKDCLFAFSILIKFRIKYHDEIMEGNQLKRLTYERYLLDYKINAKQLNSSHLSLTTLIESKKKNNSELQDIYYYYILPEWINLNRNVKLIK